MASLTAAAVQVNKNNYGNDDDSYRQYLSVSPRLAASFSVFREVKKKESCKAFGSLFVDEDRLQICVTNFTDGFYTVDLVRVKLDGSTVR